MQGAYGVYNNSLYGRTYQNGGTIDLSGSTNYGIYNEAGNIEKNGGVIRTTSYGIYNNSLNDIVMSGGTIEGNIQYGIYNNKTGRIEIKGGVIQRDTNEYIPGMAGIYNYSTGTIEMTGGKIDINNRYSTTAGATTYWIYGIYNNGTGRIIIGQGEIEVKSVWFNASGIYNKTSGIVIIGEKDDEVDLEKIIIKAKINSTVNSAYGIYQETSGTLKFYDGVIEGQEGKSIYGAVSDYEDGYNVAIYKTGETDKCDIEEGQEVSILDKLYIAHVQSNNTSYNSIYEALENTENEDTITILYDFSINEILGAIIIDANKNIVLDLNGHSISGNIGEIVKNYGKLTIKDTEENGYIKSTLNSSKVIYNNGELNLESGTIKTTGVTSYGIYNENIIDSGEEVTEVIGEKIDIGEYYFEEQEGKYVSNNQRKAATANSYWKIDLREKEGLYEIIIDANISSRVNNDYGYATIKETNGVVPEYNDAEGRFVYISGTVEDTKYSLTVEGGKEYYLYLGYRRNGTASTGEDTFTINGIEVKQVKAVANIKGGKIELASQRGGGLYGVYNKKGKVNVTGGEINVSNSAGGYRRR